MHKSICTVLHNTISLIQINLPHFSQCACIYQNLHRNFVLLHSQKSNTFVLHNTISLIQINLTHFSQSACIYQNLLRKQHNVKCNDITLYILCTKQCMYGALTLCPYPRQMYNSKCTNVHNPYPSPYVQCITIIHTSTLKQSLVSFMFLSLVLLHFLVQVKLSLST